jgi:hypothetical protein
MSRANASMIGEALFFSGLQFAIASTEMSSRFSVENFAKDQATLDNAMKALSTYTIIAMIWTLATCLLLYGDYGPLGIFWGMLTNGLFVAWILLSYYWTFVTVSKKNNLQVPSFFGTF